MSIARKTLALSLCTLLFTGCGSGSGSLSGATTSGTGQSANDDTSLPLLPDSGRPDADGAGVSAGLGRLEISIPLANARTVKADVASFRIILSQDGREFRSEDFTRAEVEALGHKVVFDNVPAGDYDVTILYLSATGTELGRFRQELTVGEGDTATIDNPGYENTKPDFETLRFLGEGRNPNHYSTGDFNGDGTLDLVYCDTNSFASLSVPESFVYIRLGTGNGYYRSASILTAPTRNLQFSAVGDLNKDGHDDLAVAGKDNIVVFLGVGDGSFLDAYLLALETDSGPVGLKIADLDKDTNLDLVATNEDSSDVSLLFGNGDGTFADAVHYAVDDGPGDLTVVDLDLDGRLDVVTVTRVGGSLSFLYSDGGRNFIRGSDIKVADGLVGVDVADINGDGFPDLACTSEEEDSVFLFLSDGIGGFVPGFSHSVGEFPSSVQLTDIDKNGSVDIFVANSETPDCSLFLADITGGFGVETRISMFGGSRSASLTDVNEDTHLDIVSCQYGGAGLIISLGGGDGTFETLPPRYATGERPIDLKSADFNNDGNLDLATADLLGNTVTIALGDGLGGFTLSSLTGVSGPRSLIVSDLNIDGNTDIVVANLSGVYTLRGNGDGTFESPASLTISGRIHGLVGADINGDGFLDIVVADDKSDTIQILAGKGNGTFEFLTSTQSLVDGFKVVASDFNEDGDIDLAALSNTETVSVLHNNGDETFAAPLLLSVPDELGGTTEVNMTTGDMNGDGHADLLVTHHIEGNVAIVPGNGDGTFGDFYEVDLLDGAGKIVVEDVNGDSIPDMLSTYAGINSAARPGVSVQTGNGDGTFEDTLNFLSGSFTSAVVSGDFNNDGGTDLAVAEKPGYLTILLAR